MGSLHCSHLLAQESLMSPLRQRMIEDMQVRNLASATQITYLEHVYRFARYFHKSPEDLGPEEIRAYQLYLINDRGLAPQSALIAVSALRFLYTVSLRACLRSSPGRRFQGYR